MTINAIDTYYAGHLFRSRLEARWAYIFDTLGIRWEYEPQGYRVGQQRRPYLPDFYLTDLGWWIEVKGDPQRLDMRLLTDAVHPTRGLGRTDPWYRTNILILGPIPDYPGQTALHFSVSRSAVLVGGPAAGCEGACYFTGPLYGLHRFAAADDIIDTAARKDVAVPDEAKDMLRRQGALITPHGRPVASVPDTDLTRAVPLAEVPGRRLETAYLLGRTARFEHGQIAA